MLRWLFGDRSEGFGEWTCPRCRTTQQYNSNEASEKVLKKGFDSCLECFAIVKFVSMEGKKKKLKVERLPEHRYARNEKQLTDEDYDLLKRTIGLLKSLEMMARGTHALELGSMLEGDYTEAIYWNMKGKQRERDPLAEKAIQDIKYLLKKYPTQTMKYFNKKGKSEYIGRALTDER